MTKMRTLVKCCKNILFLAALTCAVTMMMIAMGSIYDGFVMKTLMSQDDMDSTDHKDAGENPDTTDTLTYSRSMPWLDRSDDVHETRLLSAFWDDRQVSPYITNLVLMRTPEELQEDVRIYCFIHCADANALNPQVIPANMTDIRANLGYRKKEFDGNSFIRILIPCRPRACHKPEWVSLGYKKNSIGVMDRSNSVPVEYPSSSDQREFGICVPPIFGCLNPYRVVEWMEMQKILGVGRVVIYNNSQCEETSRVLHEYGRQGLVEIHQDRAILDFTAEDRFRDEIRSRSPLMMTDCMLRHMYDTQFLYSIDIDEVLLPLKSDSLHEMVQQIQERFGTSETHYKQMIFRSFFVLSDNFVTKKPADDSFPAITSFLRYRKRLGPPDQGSLRQKSMVWAERCGYRNNHVCRISAVEEDEYGDIEVPISIAKVFHYRSSPCTKRSSGVIRCRNGVPYKPVINDDSMLRYKDELLQNVHLQLTNLGMSTEEQ